MLRVIAVFREQHTIMTLLFFLYLLSKITVHMLALTDGPGDMKPSVKNQTPVLVAFAAHSGARMVVNLRDLSS